jgi:phospholipase C
MIRMPARGGLLVVALAHSLLTGCHKNAQSAPDGGGPATANASLAAINHIVIIYLENRSFDNLYGEFPGAAGIVGLTPEGYRQVDENGKPFDHLPQADGAPIPPDLPNAPFPIERYIPSNSPTRDLVHRFYQEQLQIHGGRMDRFALVSDAMGLTMGYYNTANLPLAAEARKYTLADRFFHAAFGGSFLNHIYFISAAAPKFPNAPAAMRAVFDASGHLVRDGAVTPDGYVVNTAFSVHQPRPGFARAETLVPAQTMPTIGDRLSDKGIRWGWYAGGWNDAVAGHADSLFQFHHQPFVYFAKYAEGTAARAEHLKDEQDFLAAARSGTLPSVAFVKPIGAQNEHPGYADLLAGERHTVELIDAVRNGANWKDVAIIVTYDENGGFWDHVAPPARDRWGPGARVPTIIISPFARRGFVDHTTYDTMSILAFIEHRFALAPLGTADASAADLAAAFDLRMR